jgi:hypothetical protein
MQVPVAPPAGPARPSPRLRPDPAASDPRRAGRFAALLGRRPPREADERSERAAGDATALAPPPGFAPCPAAGPPAAPAPPSARAEAGTAAAAAADLVESVRVGLDRAGQAEVRFDVADGPLKGLEVRLLAASGGVEASFVAEDAATRRALAEPLQELRRTLADQGVTVARLEVAVRADVGGHGARRGHEAAPAPVAAAARAGGLPPLRAGTPTDWVA